MTSEHAREPDLIAFDIETGPLDKDAILAITKPFPDFDEQAIIRKFKTAQDPKKGPAFIQQKRDDHDQAEADYWEDAISKAALSPMTGRVLCIGVMTSRTRKLCLFEGDPTTDLGSRERQILCAFWNRVANAPAWSKWVGWNSEAFDLPFLFRRSWVHGILPPAGVRRGRYWSEAFIDAMKEWCCHAYGERAALDTVARFLGLPGKGDSVGVVDGESFHRFWLGSVAERKLAVEYLEADLRATLGIAERVLGAPWMGQGTTLEGQPV